MTHHVQPIHQDSYEALLRNLSRYGSVGAIQTKVIACGLDAPGDPKWLQRRVVTKKKHVGVVLQDYLSWVKRDELRPDSYRMGRFEYQIISTKDVLVYCVGLAQQDGLVPEFFVRLLRERAVTADHLVRILRKYYTLHQFVAAKLVDVYAYLRGTALVSGSTNGFAYFVFDRAYPQLPGLAGALGAECRAIYRPVGAAVIYYYNEFGDEVSMSGYPFPINSVSRQGGHDSHVATHYRRVKLETLASFAQ